jgi:hypothetical protein
MTEQIHDPGLVTAREQFVVQLFELRVAHVSERARRQLGVWGVAAACPRWIEAMTPNAVRSGD